MADGWLRYGLEENPFEAPVLDCIRSQEDRNRYGHIFFSDTEELEFEREIRKAIKAKSMAFFVVSGPDGSGRTVFARNLICRYEQIKGVDSSKFAFAEHDPEDNVSASQVLHALITFLADEAKLLQATFGQDPSGSLHTALLANSPQNLNSSSMQSVLRAFSETMRKAGGGFGCMLENVPKAEMLNEAYRIFQKADTIVICTVRDADRDEALLRNKQKFLEITMPHLTPGQVWNALYDRWIKWQAKKPVPLPQTAVEKYVAVPPPTMGWLFTQAAMMFDHKLASHLNDETWPEDQALGFTDQDVQHALSFIRKHFKRGGKA